MSHEQMPSEDSDVWTFYVIESSTGSWYAGVTTDFDRRLQQHNRGVGAKYTRGRGPFTPVYRIGMLDRSAALRTEAAFKKLSRKDKEALVSGDSRLLDKVLPNTVFGMSVWRCNGDTATNRTCG